MWIGKWNKSVILTYIGLAIGILGIYLCCAGQNSILMVMSCLVIAGMCDLFDGFIARKCQRTETEECFGVQLDSLTDVVNFIVLPICICLKIGLNQWYHLIIFVFFAVCGIARLAHFNIMVKDDSRPVRYYPGLPVTYTALILPIVYLSRYALDTRYFIILYSLLLIVIATLNVLNIKIKKPRGSAYILFSVIAIMLLIIYFLIL